MRDTEPSALLPGWCARAALAEPLAVVGGGAAVADRRAAPPARRGRLPPRSDAHRRVQVRLVGRAVASILGARSVRGLRLADLSLLRTGLPAARSGLGRARAQ